MADRKKAKEQAIAESIEMSKAPAPKAKPKTPAEKLKNFSISSREKAEAAAPIHPKAGKGQQIRNRELQAGMAAGRAQSGLVEAVGKANIKAGKGLIGHKQVTRAGVKNIVAVPAKPEMVAEVPKSTKPKAVSKKRRAPKKVLSSGYRTKNA